ncbi:AraC family transcriptional regulator [Paenibacillus sp. 1011MAR3C5]|uniref:helix-turn-helix domain-containing protein n=1 Tax=Paenibacillus sp. 1011MAR3C5 TaxID=1675787 RepID=UPI001600D8C0|nr:AraC family transcriptional regulator [Paenibacillus sp. 1011MAR3C5]
MKNQGTFQIFFAMLLVIGIMVISMYYLYRNSISGIYDRMTENNSLAVKAMIGSFDNNFRSINNLIHSIHMLPYNVLEPGEDGQVDMSDVYLLQDNLASLVSSVDFIEEAVIFYDNHDLVITSSGTSSLTQFFNQKYKHDRFNVNYWRTYMKERNSFKVFHGDYYRISSDTFKETTKKLMIAAGGNKVRLSNKNVMLLINEKAFMKQVSQNLMIPGASLIVLDQNQQVVYSTDSTLNITGMMEEVYLSATQEASLTRENYEYHFYKSDFNEFIYVEKIPFQFQNIDSVSQANRLIMFTAILCAILLSILLSIYLNKPVKRILHQLGGRHGGNDFAKILSGIKHMQAENETYKKQLAFVDAEARRGILLLALDERELSAEHEQLMHRYETDFFLNKQFVMVMFRWSAPAQAEEGVNVSAERMAELLRTGLRDRQAMANVYHERELQFLALIGIRQSSERDTLLKLLGLLLGQLQQGELSGYTGIACVSKVYASELSNCSKAYQSLTSAMAYRHVNERAAVIDAGKLEYEWNMPLPIEKLEKLASFVMNGKLKESKAIITETIRETAQRNVHQHQFAYIAKSLFYAMVRHASPSANRNNELYLLESEFLRAAETTGASPEKLEQLLHDAAQHIVHHSEAAEPASKLNKAYISQYIELNYMRNLYLDQLAEVTGTSSKYFSSYFKKTFGVNYVEYLNKVRLSHARELLKHSNYSVSEIGERTGYLNSSTFTTTFKKYYGISPSEYRKQKQNTG